ncbi:3'-5' exonuclease [Chromobacterium phragmitis]|uniref:3'-5' exonuclease n=1 Tax=Chromobacterium phragmitis TaxID=2202141 RepID=A0A344UEE5_9NEIS|nr:3'-5' exonuclease [Chromobacterium phragmitis]AXE32303.1 3'-5' exonuclease [Chromobacterium phragmitis]AXE33643.1 3'-5' exonuclease [Chromobacterium phragmitis]
MLATLRRRWLLARLRDPARAALLDEHPDEIVSLDCETTSLNAAEAELLAIGAVRLRGDRILHSEALCLLVRPEAEPSAGNIAVHGLRRRDLAEGIPPREAVERLLDFIGGRPLLGYYLEYDIAVLDKYVKPLLGIGLPQRRIELSARYYDYRFRQRPDANIDLSLDALHQALDMPALPRHDALNDALSAAMLYQALRRRGFG